MEDPRPDSADGESDSEKKLSAQGDSIWNDVAYRLLRHLFDSQCRLVRKRFRRWENLYSVPSKDQFLVCAK